MMKRLAVYCGSSLGCHPSFQDSARNLGLAMLQNRIDLVYGGGRLGLMGVIADTVLAGGGRVYGVIPRSLVDLEVAHPGLTELRVVQSMHERKAAMTELADAFLCLPGGIGTLDEMFEAWTWNALGYHSKPLALLNIGGFWDGLIEFLGSATGAGFISPARRAQLLVAEDAEEAISLLEASCDSGARMTW